VTDAYPLAWPEGWPRTPSHRRSSSRFKTNFVKARSHLFSELRLLGARNIVLSSNLALRQDGLPYADAAKKRLDDPGAAVYFLLDREPLVMARDLYLTPGENIHSIGLAIEHLRGLQRHGGDFMMKKAFAGFAALPPPSEVSWWQTLQVRPDASKDEINAAYRRLAAERHPDRGGTDAMMSDLNRARTEALRDRP
jgi:hypothetical protein